MRGNHWKGGKTIRNGYIMTYSPKHPHRKGNNYVFEHRLVVEKILGRYLRPSEVIHHVNHIRTDNRPENLVILTSKEHSALHKDLKGKWSIKFDNCVECKTNKRPHAAKGLCKYCYKRSFGNRNGKTPGYPKRIVFNNEIASSASRRLGGCRMLVSSRIKSGWSLEKAFTTALTQS